MSIGIGIGNGISIRSGSSHWTQQKWIDLFTTIGYTHPMLTDPWFKKVAGVWQIQNYTIDSFRTVYASPVVKYVNWSTGVDTNSGDTPALAYKTMAKLTSVTFDRAYFEAGNYATVNSTNVFAQSREIFSRNGRARLMRGSTGEMNTWTALGAGDYSTPYAAVPVGCFDDSFTNADGDPLPLVSVANAAAVASTTNSYWLDDPGNILYVHLSDGRQPDNHFYLNTTYLVVAKGKTHYCEDIDFVGVSVNNDTAVVNTLLFKNCRSVHAKPTHGFELNGNTRTWLQDCISNNSISDGISYGQSGIYSASGIEINCSTKNNGLVSGASGTLNGSTGHGTAVILRVNGNYTYSRGPSVHDIDSVKSFNIGCIAGFSFSDVADYKSAYAVAADASGDATEMYLFECTALDSANTYGAENRELVTSSIYARDCTITNLRGATVLIPF